MKYIELQEAFEREINMLDNDLEKPASTDTEYWLNRGLEKFYKTRYLDFERTQKRTDDLRSLVCTRTFELDDQSYKVVQENSARINITLRSGIANENVPVDKIYAADRNTFYLRLPENYVLLLGDTAGIIPTCEKCIKCAEKDEFGQLVIQYADVIESTLETIDKQLFNSLSEHRYKYNSARPLRLIQDNTVILYTDGKYKIQEYVLSYLRCPVSIDIHNNPFDKYTDMPEHTHMEIVKLAAQMYLENQRSDRYNTYSNEVNTME